MRQRAAPDASESVDAESDRHDPRLSCIPSVLATVGGIQKYAEIVKAKNRMIPAC
jgi:hypothetical protein